MNRTPLSAREEIKKKGKSFAKVSEHDDDDDNSKKERESWLKRAGDKEQKRNTREWLGNDVEKIEL